MPDNEWQQKIFKPLSLGYNSSQVPNAIPDGASPKVENMVIHRGRLETDLGYVVKGDVLRGRPRLSHQFNYKDGSTELTLFTDLTGYRWKTGEWQYIPSTNRTAINNGGGYPATTTTMTVDDASNFEDGDFVAFLLDDGTEHKTTIDGAPAGNDITVDDGIPAGRSVEDGGIVIEPVVFTGDSDNQPTADTFPAADVMFYSNNSDNVQYYDGTEMDDVPNLVTGVGGGNCYARIVRIMDNKVILFNTNENGSDFPQRVRWCAVGDYTDWTGVNDAGYEDLYGDADWIVAAEKLPPYMIVYRETKVVRMEYVGSAALIFNFVDVVGIDGAASTQGIVTRESFHIVVGNKGLYAYGGDFDFQEFGMEIWEDLFGYEAELNNTYKRLIYAKYIASRKEYWIAVPVNGAQFPNKIWRYSVQDKAFTSRIFNDYITGFQDVETSSGITWAAASGQWTNAAWAIPWNDLSLLTGEAIILMFGEASGGGYYCWHYDLSATEDSGEAIVADYYTKELYAPNEKVRINRVMAFCKGASITVEYSDDEGSSWTSYGTMTPGINYTLSTVWKQIGGERFMFRFTGSSIGLDYIIIEYQIESRW